MKKILSLATAFAFALALAAAPAMQAKADDAKAYPNCNEDGSINYDTIAHFDSDYDYSQTEKVKVAYISQAGTVLYQQSADAYEHWAPLFNME